MKKILILGGSFAQVPFIIEAKKRGYFTVLIDYLPENPGRELVDEYYNCSTTDRDKVTEIALQVRPDVVFSYASDPAAPVAAFVAEKLGLQCNSLQSIRLLTEKHLFRELQATNGFNCPKYMTVSDEGFNQFSVDEELAFPVIVKPTDASGSKGVSRVDSLEELGAAIATAAPFSRNRKIIVETFIDNEIADVHGDGFVVEGQLVFHCLGDHLYGNESHPFNPTGTSWPSVVEEEAINRIIADVQEIITLSGFRNGAVNIEARIDGEGKHYIMEIGPRNGGHFVPSAVRYASGFDSLAACFDMLDQKNIIFPTGKLTPSAYIALHSETEGTLKNITFCDKIKPFVRNFYQYIPLGGKVRSFSAADAVIGIMLLTFTSQEEMACWLRHIKQSIALEIA